MTTPFNPDNTYASQPPITEEDLSPEQREWLQKMRENLFHPPPRPQQPKVGDVYADEAEAEAGGAEAPAANATAPNWNNPAPVGVEVQAQ